MMIKQTGRLVWGLPVCLSWRWFDAYVFERLRKPACCINVENGVEILLRFSREHYHHLAGFQHLTDLPDIASPANGRQKFYNDIRKGNIPEERIWSQNMLAIQNGGDLFQAQSVLLNGKRAVNSADPIGAAQIGIS